MSEGAKASAESIIRDAMSSQMDDLAQKQLDIKTHDINVRHDRIQETKKQRNVLNSVNLKEKNQSRINDIMDDSTEYLRNVKKASRFLNNEDFDGVIPAFGKNIITIVAKSGSGKSTTCANIGYSYAVDGKKGLIITNEENPADCYNRMTCLNKGWHYVNHANFTEEQIATFAKYTDILSERITVLDDAYNGEIGQTSTIEGIKGIFDHIINNKIHYDFIVIDYYQNIDSSIDDPSATEWAVQARFCKYIDKIKNILTNTPIYILAQQKDYAQEGGSFKDSIEGRKLIYNVSTCVIEMFAEREKLMTGWRVRKSRFNESVGETLWTGYKKGLFVRNTDEYQLEADQYKRKKESQRICSEIHIKKNE